MADKHGKTFQPGSHYFVGGASKMYGAAHFRLRERDFESVMHVDGESPEWPLKYDVFEPYYRKAEEWYHVHGLRGEDPTEPPASSAYPYAPISHEPRMQKLVDDLRSAGLHPFHAPTGVALDEANPAFSACVRCNRCDGFPCLVQAKGDAEVMGVRPALDHDNVFLLTDAEVLRLNTDESGREVTDVVVNHLGQERRFKGDIVVVSAGAANSARLLLMSANDAHPRGLANSSDQVGRNYMYHNCKAVVALAHEPNTTVFQKTVALHDWYFGDNDFDFPMGNVQMTGKTNGAMMKGYKPRLTALAPTWSMDKIAEHSLDFWLQTEDLPLANNRVTINGQGQIKLDYTRLIPGHPTSWSSWRDCSTSSTSKTSRRASGVFRLLDEYYGSRPSVRHLSLRHRLQHLGVGHQLPNHDVENLYVVDTSFFPSSSAVNPSLTAIANTIRVANHLKERLS